jgi:glycosyltransferase involved in cell wall biosynthesis
MERAHGDAHGGAPSVRQPSPRSQPRVSVLLPVHNGERFLEETLRSISAQTYEDLELVVVDDGSTDDTQPILSRYAALDPRLRVVHQVKAGISAALNTGLAACRGELVARIDADDVMIRERVATQVAFLDAHPELGFCGSSVELMDARGRTFGHHSSGLHHLAHLDRAVTERRGFAYTHPSVMYRRDDVVAAGGYRASYEPCEDLDLFLRLIDTGRPGLDLPQPLVRYRQHSGSLSAGNALAQVRMRKLLFHNFYAVGDGLPPQDYATFMRSGPGSGTGARWRDATEALGAAAGYRIVDGRPVSGWLLGGVAVLMKMPRVFARRRRVGYPSDAPSLRSGLVSPSPVRSAWSSSRG